MAELTTSKSDCGNCDGIYANKKGLILVGASSCISVES